MLWRIHVAIRQYFQAKVPAGPAGNAELFRAAYWSQARWWDSFAA
jgi:hypothetical protein